MELKTRSQPIDPPDKDICGICKRQTSRYTCPSCNIPYCSLTCFRSEKHAECSEKFYRKEIESDIRGDPIKSLAERTRMLQLLRRFEEENAPELPFDDDAVVLAQKLDGINIDDADPDSLWDMLSPAQRDSFLKAMRDPSSDLARQLLGSSELESQRKKPWWESPALSADDSSEATAEFGALPGMMSIPDGLRAAQSPSTPGVSLVYNILALCLVYAYVTRRLSVSPLSSLHANDPDRLIAVDLLSQLAPFLTDRKSRMVFRSVESLVTDVWSRLEALSDPSSRASLALYLADAARLMRPQHAMIIGSGELHDHPSRMALLAISDIAHLFSAAPRSAHVTHKLNFYAAHLRIRHPDVLHVAADEARIAGLDMDTHTQLAG